MDDENTTDDPLAGETQPAAESESAQSAETASHQSEMAGDGDGDADASDGDAETPPELSYRDTGRDDLRKAVDKVQAARSGDAALQEDISDVPRRWRVLKTFRPDVTRALVETTLPALLVVYAAFLAAVLLSVQDGSTAELYLTATNRIGDLFLFNIGLIALLVGVFLVGPRVARTLDVEVSGRLTTGLRYGAILAQLVPAVLLTIFVAASVRGDRIARRAYELFYATLGSVQADVPRVLVEVGATYFELSPIGFSVADLLAVMFGIGVILTLPYGVRLVKAIVYVTASDPEEFPRVEVDPEELHDEPDPREAVSWEPTDTDDTASHEPADTASVEALLAVPEAMRMEPYPNYVEVERYWVRAPYSYVSILRDEVQSDYRYFLMEPQLEDGEEELLLEEFNDRLETTLLLKDIDDDFETDVELEKKVDVIEDEVLHLANEYNISADEETFHKLLYHIERDYVFYGKIDALIRDPNIEDISCDGDNVPLFVFHRHHNDLMTNIAFEKQNLRQFIIELAQRSGEHISAAKPLLDASLPNGSRIQMSLGSEITTHGSTFTIRLFQDTPFTPVNLIKTKTFSLEQMAYLWQAIQYDKSLIFAGGTASGKTTSMNAVSLFIPPKSKVVTIEDTREITLPHLNWVPGVTREGFGASPEEGGPGEIDMYKLLESALRQRPEYMIVGEIRGDEAQSLFQAMSTGHTTYSTMHADSPKRAVNRLTNPPINVPRDMISSLDIICIQNQVRVQDEETGDVKNVRRNESTEEIVDVGETVRTSQPFYRDAEMDEFRTNLNDSQVLEEIREEQGWSSAELQDDLQARQDVLQFLIDEDIDGVEAVTQTIQAYMLNPSRVTAAARDGTLDPEEYRDITDVQFREPDDRIETPRDTDEVASARELPESEQPDGDGW